MKIALICSSGGHFIQLHSLKGFWSFYERFWVTFPGGDTGSLLKNEKAYWAYHPTNRNLVNLVRNFFLALKILKKERPGALVTTGAGVAVPFIYAARILGIRTVFIESLTRIPKISLSGKLVYHLADEFLVQWPELAVKYKKVKFKGQVI